MADARITELTAYTPPIDTDVLAIVDITTTTTKKITWASIKSALKTYFDGIYATKTTAWTGFTPNMYGSGGSAGTYSQTVTNCRYTVVGGICTVNVYFQVTNVGSWTGTIYMDLPVATATAANKVIHNLWIQPNTGVPIVGARASFVGANTSALYAIKTCPSTAGAWGTDLQANDFIWGVFSYEV